MLQSINHHINVNVCCFKHLAEYVRAYIILHGKSLQLCTTLCDPMECGLLGFSVHGILQARILEWVALPHSKGYIRLK